MRDFRDAKVMAHALRDCLKSRAVEITHSESLELIAREFGFDNWNILAAKIDAAQLRAAPEPAPAAAGSQDSAPDTTLYCSFCGKSQHEVRKLIAGPAVYICDECVDLCTEIVREEAPFWKVLSLLRAGEDSGDDDPGRAALEYVRGKPTEEVIPYVEQCRRRAEEMRLVLSCIRRSLIMRDGEIPAEDDILASRRFAYLGKKTREELRVMQPEMQRVLKHHEDALRIGTAVLGERGEQ